MELDLFLSSLVMSHILELAPLLSVFSDNYPNGTYKPSESFCRQQTCDSASTFCPGIGCVNINTNDNANCGRCGNRCASNQLCIEGTCTACKDVPWGKHEECDGKCVAVEYR